MKDIVKWTVYLIILMALAALTVCYIAVPRETSAVIDKIVQYANTPIAIAGVSTTIGGALIFIISKYILSTTKLGRKELDSMREDMKEFKEGTTNTVQDYKAKFDDLLSQAEALKKDTENQVTIVYNEFTDLKNTVLTSLKAFPNKRIREIVNKYEIEFAEREKDIIQKTINTNDFIDNKIEEIKSQYNDMFNELLEKVESALNEKAEERENG